MKQFKPSVLIKVREGGRVLTREVRDVLTASGVHLSWTGRGKAWRRAADVLADALSGDATPDEAREAFVAAAREAGVLIERE